MSKHTPGPWEDHGSCSSGHEIKAKIARIGEDFITLFHAPSIKEISFRLNEKGELWGLLCYESYVQFPSDNWEKMQEANIRLITAAPDLLEACKGLMGILTSKQINRFPNNYKKAKKAIAKAGGGA